jgi:hypothetical protein
MNVVSLPKLEKLTNIQFPSADDPIVGKTKSWWGVRVVGTDVALIFPRNLTSVIVRTDGDGAEFHINTQPTWERAERNEAVDSFEREWGKWLDPDVTLTQAELEEGIKKAEAML